MATTPITNNLKYGIYIFYIILYLIFFGFLFQPNVENLVMVMIFILVTISGFNLIMDIQDNKTVVFDFKMISDFINDRNGSIVKELLFSPMSLFIVCVILIVAVALYITSTATISPGFIYFLATYLGVTSFFTLGNSIPGGIPFYIVIGIPMMLLIISLIMMMVTIYNYDISSNKNGLYSKFIFLSNIDATDTFNYKVAMIVEILLMFLILSYLFIYLGGNRADASVQSILYAVVPAIYGLAGYLVFLGNKLLQVKFP